MKHENKDRSNQIKMRGKFNDLDQITSLLANTRIRGFIRMLISIPSNRSSKKTLADAIAKTEKRIREKNLGFAISCENGADYTGSVKIEGVLYSGVSVNFCVVTWTYRKLTCRIWSVIGVTWK